MDDSWATFGTDLHLDLTGSRISAALERSLRDAVRTGRLTPGTRLPSSRSLAGDLGIARNTVADAYGQLVAEGWLDARRGSGTRVADRVTRAAPAPQPTAKPAPIAYDLRPGSPDLSAFPRSAWLSAARRALATAPSEALGYGDRRGRRELRRALAAYLGRARGVHADPSRVFICTGATQAVSLLCAALRAGGASTLALESPGFRVFPDVVAAAGLAVAPLTVDGGGADIGELHVSGADAVLLAPAHQFPTGVALSPGRRAAAVDWARNSGGVVIEDDYDAEFRYDRQPVGALQGLDPESVVYVGTASKSLAPGLRLGWMVLPSWLVEPVTTAKEAADLQTGTFEQLVLAEFIESGAFDRHVRGSRLRYRRRRDRLVATLADRVPRVRVSGIAAGLHALLRLPGGLRAGDEQAIVDWAGARGLALWGLNGCRLVPEDDAPAALVVGYGTPPDHAYAGALDALCDILSQPSTRFRRH
ncbi:MAG TPA: PLP-dependent aminotransferase family protein [Micromonosporaceae bacterium]